MRKKHNYVLYLIVAINVLIYLIGLYKVDGIYVHKRLVSEYALYIYPNYNSSFLDIFRNIDLDLMKRIAVSKFLHSGLEHLASNMLTLWIFSISIEKMSNFKYFILYVLGGITASITSIWYYQMFSNSIVVTLGASGAVYAVIGAAFTYPEFRRNNRYLIPALVYILYIMFFQNAPGTNVIAHIGGFFMGLLLGYIFKCMERRR